MARTSTIRKRRAISRRTISVLAVVIYVQLFAGLAAVPLTREASALAALDLPAPQQERSVPRRPVVKPARIDIPKLGVSAGVDEIGLAENGEIAVPEVFDRTGWYGGLEAPGEIGTAVIVGHLDSYTGPAVFIDVPTLAPGDEINVALADESIVPFIVERVEQYAKDNFPTIAVYAPSGQRSLRLITCGGKFDKKTRHYRDNVVVYANAKEA